MKLGPLFRFLGILVFIGILFKVNISEIIISLYNANIVFILLSLSLTLPAYLIKALRWRGLVSKYVPYSLKDSFVEYLIGMFFAMFTPGKSGDFIKSVYLYRNRKISLGLSFSLGVIDRLFDFIFLLLFSSIGLISLISDTENLTVNFLFSLIILAILLVITKKNFRLTYRLLPEKYKGSIKNNIGDFYNGFKNIDFMSFGIAAILTGLFWGIHFIQVYFLAIALNLHIPFYYLAMSVSIAFVINIIPISILGIGTRDATLIMFFSKVGVNRESAISFSALLLFTYLFVGLLGMIGWTKKPIKI